MNATQSKPAPENDPPVRQAGAKRNRRRTYVVNPRFQWKYAITIAVTVFLISSIMSSLLYGVLHSQARLRAASPQTYVTDVTLVIVFAGVAFSLLTAAGIGLWSLVVTHRICGPLTVMAQWLKELGEGRFPRLRPLRSKDEFKDFFAVFTSTVDALKAGKRAQLTVLNKTVSLARSASRADDDSRKNILSALTTELETLRRETAEFLGEEVHESNATSAKNHGECAKQTVTAGQA